MKKSLCFAVVGFVVLVSLPASARILVYEPFAYPNGILTGQGGALGTTGTWVSEESLHPGVGWRVHQQGETSGIVVDPGPPVQRNMFGGTVANLATLGGYVGLPGPEDVGEPDLNRDFEIGRYMDASIALDPSVTATFRSGATTWFSYVAVHAWDRNEETPNLMLATDPTVLSNRAFSMQNSGSGIGAGGGPPRNNRPDILPRYFKEGASYNLMGAATAWTDDAKEAPDATATMPWVASDADGFGAVNIIVGKIEWDADTGGEDIISVARFLETDVLSEEAFDALIALKPGLSSRNWTGNKPNLDQSQFDLLNIAGTKFFVDEIRIGTTFADVVGGSAETGSSSDPSPSDESTDVPRDVTLSWTPGIFAAPTKGHKVYFGESFNDVNNAAGGVAQDANSYTPALDFGKTYYWRVDEVNAPPTSHIEFKGEVWSFTTEPIGYPIDGNNITPTASSSEIDVGPGNTVNGSGLGADDLHSIVSTAMWLSSSTGSQPTWIQYEFDKAYKLHEMWVWNYNVQFENVIGFGLKDVTVQYSTDSLDWKVLSDVRFARGPGAAGYAHDTIVDFGGIVAKYVKITAKSNWGGQAQYGLSEVRFFYIPVWAREPNPDSGATGVSVDNVSVSWRAGREAASHKVYFSTSRKAVIDETISPVSIPANGSYGSHNVGALDLGRTYYWKVNEVNEAEIPTTWKGDIWNFKTAEYLVVDDLESYGDGTDAGPPPLPGNRIWYTWKDGGGWTSPAPGWGGNGTGSVIDLSTSITHDGSRQALTLNYDNDGTNMLGQAGKKFYSEITADLANLGISSDWTRNGVKALTLYFYGDPNNNATAAEQMYVKVNGVKRVYDGDMADIRTATWHEWNIDLSLVGTNLQNVTQISIGFGNENATTTGGSGTIFIDDIRLYPSRCIPSMGKPTADLSGNCVVDQADVDILANLWLDSGFQITPVNPGTSGLLAHYPLNGNANDAVGGRNGTVNGNPQWVTGSLEGALKFGGNGDYVGIGYSPDLALNEFTVSAWVKVAADPGVFGILGTRSGGEYTFDLKVQAANVHGDIGTGTAWINTAIDIGSGDTGTTGQGGDLVVYRWYMIAYVIDNTHQQVKLYLDGDLKRTITISGTPLLMQSSESMRIGDTGYSEWMNGLIDEVRIYKRALSAAEIAWLAGYTSLLSIPADLHQDGKIDFKDFAVLADSWLEELLWP
jgi:hypothetical protein